METKKILSSFLGQTISRWLNEDLKTQFERNKTTPIDEPKEIEPQSLEKPADEQKQESPSKRLPKNPPWQEEVPPDEITIDLHPKINHYAQHQVRVNLYDSQTAKLDKRKQIYLYELDQKNNGKKGLKPVK
jgi:hypothetical protein